MSADKKTAEQSQQEQFSELSSKSPGLAQTFERIQKDIEKREAQKVYQLEIWPNRQMGVPNEITRSALFAAIQAKGRGYLDNQAISSQTGFQIIYTGPRLDQDHLDVFEGIMHFARGFHEGNKIRFTAHSLLKLIGRHTGGNQHKWLFRRLQQLTATSVAIIKDDKRVFWGSLLPSGAARLDTGEYAVEISRDLIKMFGRGFTRIEWNQRHRLICKPLAQWLQLYYMSHARPVPVSVAFIRETSGSTTQSLRKFRQNLKAALSEVQAVGVISSWHIDAKTDLVHVVRLPLPSQPNHSNNGQD
ncbi:MAG: plasmid replication initiator TrfA [Desulfobacca sp.]|nr:plasmid replication initiator TrfA [Desulfobacca sp.]